VIGDRWGVSESETLRSYPCDDFVASPTLQAWRGVRVEAPASVVWPWVAQVRLAPYSYDWIDNRGRRSPRELAGLPEPQAGDSFTTVAGRELGRIVSVDPGKQLTGTIMGAFMSYVLVPQGPDTTRLLRPCGRAISPCETFSVTSHTLRRDEPDKPGTKACVRYERSKRSWLRPGGLRRPGRGQSEVCQVWRASAALIWSRRSSASSPVTYWPAVVAGGWQALGPSENIEVVRETRSTASTLSLGSIVQPGWGHPELAATTALSVAR
jgi:hypothetical protein